MLQETVVLEEAGRIERDEGQALEFDSLMEELYQGLFLSQGLHVNFSMSVKCRIYRNDKSQPNHSKNHNYLIKP